MKLVEVSESKFYFDSVSLLVDGLQDTENASLAVHKAANDNSVRSLQRLLFFMIAGIVLLMFVFYRKTKADNAEKEKAAANLKKLNDELEQRVKERTEELSIKEELFRVLVENNEGIICLIDEKLNVLFRSSSTGQVTGRLIGENTVIAFSEYVHPGDTEQLKILMTQVITNPGKTIPVSIRLRHEEGHYIWLEGVAKNMLHDRAISGIILNLRDISERKKDEIRIRSAIERYDILAQATSDTIWDWDIVKNTMFYNDGISKTFGYQASEVKNLVDWWNEKIYPGDFKKIADTLEEVFDNRLEKFQLNYRFRCADGSYRYIYDRAFVIFDESGNPSRMIGAMQDITYQVEEEMRISKAILDAQERERGFIGGELHDNVNQLLASSLMALNMVKTNHTKTKSSFGFIEMGKAHILNAVDEVRKLSHRLAPASFDENTLKDAFENLLQSFNVNKQFNIKLNFDLLCNAVNGNIQINLYRILQEQIKNIVKYADASEIEITVTQAQDTIMMRIYDNGKGFDVKTAKKGIGLSNIKKRAESFSGKFILNSAKGKGCEILLELPLAKAS
jgi:PAS domain S-box-containing protein